MITPAVLATDGDPVTRESPSHKKRTWYRLLARILLGCHNIDEEDSDIKVSLFSGTNHKTKSMGSSRKSTKPLPDAKTNNKKEQRRNIVEPVSTAFADTMTKIKQHNRRRRRRDAVHEESEESIFQDMSEVQRVIAYSWFYDHPEELPERESAATKMATRKPRRIKVQFDLGIWQRARKMPFGLVDGEDLVDGMDPLDAPGFLRKKQRPIDEKPVPETLTFIRTKSNSV
ncbi:Hypothetical predicted protein [Lecanosticta acicola]|uniref:Uncharacterized protein n=1 Tax=Lecanosticta acicola TaxID=111012 RepID=A0AAI8YTD5_9PEZI|nr:Hypothetical predicted protein [Lecanosticta acicola]